MVEVPLSSGEAELSPETAAAMEERVVTPVNWPSREAPPAPAEEDVVASGEFRKKRKYVEAEMDMTPMVDVTFLLLIFFMVTAAFAVQKAKEIPKPEPLDEGAAARSFQVLEDDPDYVTINVDEFGTYRVATVEWERDAFSSHQLRKHLKEARRGTDGHVPSHLLVRAHGDARHEKVVTALDAGNEVGMDDVTLLTYEEED
jgi:biopolymer transport protein ExbD